MSVIPAAIAERFAAAMAEFAPFESAPGLAVAVSGGADSMAACLMARDWAAARGGSVLALTVDHRLRPESAAEAARVGVWMQKLGIAHRIAVWTEPRPACGIEAAARVARRRMLHRLCAEAGILHLIVAHHAGDQAETVLMRRARAGGDGTVRLGEAGMADLEHWPRLRELRPCLGLTHAELTAVCRAVGQPWVEDSSNASDAFERNRVRKALAAAGESDRAALSSGIVAARAGRTAAEATLAGLAQAHVRLSADGLAWLDVRGLARARPEDGVRLIARLVQCVGGGAYPPRGRPAVRAAAAVLSGRPATLGHCVFSPVEGGGWVLVAHERRGLPSRAAGRWDGRFFCPPGAEPRYPATATERRAVADLRRGPGEPELSRRAAAAVPVTGSVDRVCAAVEVGYDRNRAPLRFAPVAGLTRAAFWLAPNPADLIL